MVGGIEILVVYWGFGMFVLHSPAMDCKISYECGECDSGEGKGRQGKITALFVCVWDSCLSLFRLFVCCVLGIFSLRCVKFIVV